MLLYKFNLEEGWVYIYRQRHNGVVRFLSYMSFLYAPGFISKSSKLTKNKYVSSLILRFFIRLINCTHRPKGVSSFSHSANETLCSFTSAKSIASIGVDVEYITDKPRKSIITYLDDIINNDMKRISAAPHLMTIIIISCMESAFKAWSFLIKRNFSLDIFDVLLITESLCRLRIKLNENEFLTANVNYILKDRRVVSVCCVRNPALT